MFHHILFLSWGSLAMKKGTVRFGSSNALGVVRVASVRRVPTVSPSALTLLSTTIRTRRPSLIVCANSRVGNCNIACGNGAGGRLRTTITGAVATLLRPIAQHRVPFTIAFNGRSQRINVDGTSRFGSVCGSLPNYVKRRTRNVPNNNACTIPLATSSNSKHAIVGLCLFSANASTGNNKCRTFSPTVVS